MRLLGLMLLGWIAATTPAAADRTFTNPTLQDGFRLDWCREWGTNCGQPAADAFCQSLGFPRARSFQPAEDVGRFASTRVIGTGQVCSESFCDGFSMIQCAEETQAAMVFVNCQVTPCVMGVAAPGYAVPGNQRFAEGWRRFNTNPYPLTDFPDQAAAWRFACRIHYSDARFSAPDIVQGRVNCASLCGGNPRCP
jgi:hypothetical protein